MLELKQLVMKHDCNDQLSVFNYYVEAEQKVKATTDAHFRENSCILFFSNES